MTYYLANYGEETFQEQKGDRGGTELLKVRTQQLRVQESLNLMPPQSVINLGYKKFQKSHIQGPPKFQILGYYIINY